jgi:hypothetical protein
MMKQDNDGRTYALFVREHILVISVVADSHIHVAFVKPWSGGGWSLTAACVAKELVAAHVRKAKPTPLASPTSQQVWAAGALLRSQVMTIS